jgi:Peptidase family M1 domain
VLKIPGWTNLKRLLNKPVFRQILLYGLGIFSPFLKASPQAYFQQEVNYKINVTLNDRNHELNGFESVGYINNSPDTLGFLYFHLWPNAYRDNKTDLAKELFSVNGKSALFNDKELRGYIDSLDFEADGHRVNWNLLPGSPDICKIILNKPLKPSDTIFISTPFHVKIPKGVTSRLGHIGESYQISQWYPKPAVYDRSGWHAMPYLDQGEFYSEYGSFDVSITLPANYVVGATGNLRNEEEKEFLDNLSADTSWIKTADSKEEEFQVSSARMKTLRYTETRIHDFAWFADKRFHVLTGKIKLPDSGREVTTWAMFTNEEARIWIDAISYINNAILYFSKCVGDYPYNNFTAVQSALTSGAGMEYPGMTVIGIAKDPYLLDAVLAHEICHNWFYSALGSDERRFPFMDESIVSSYESRYLEEKYPEKKLWEIDIKNRKLAKLFQVEKMPVQRIQELEWLVPARLNAEQPANLSAMEYSPTDYNTIIYYKAAQGFTYLRDYLGDPLFDSIMHNYYRIWKNKHPQPEDLKAVFQSGTSKNLSWFFDDFLGTTRRLDYKMSRIEDQKLLIKNNGEMDAPFILAAMNGDSVSSAHWEDGFKGKKWITLTPDNYSELRIDPRHKMTELFRLNNNIRTSGLLKKADPLQFRFLYTIEDPDKRYLIYLPAFNWNNIDKFMAGAILYNGTLIPRPVEYIFIPLYGFGNNRFTGYGKISFNHTPYNNIIRLATFTLEGSQFGALGNQNYRAGMIGLDLNFRSDNKINPINQKLFGHFFNASDLIQIEQAIRADMKSYLQFGYRIERSGIINPFNMLVSLEAGKSYSKTSLDLNYKYSFYGKNGLDIRIFAGTMLNNDPEDPLYEFSPGGRSGGEQYLYQGYFPYRFSESSDNFWSKQMTLSEGGLITPVNDTLGYSHWICSLTLTCSLPGKASLIPVKPFVNLLVNDHGIGTTNKSPLFFEAGFKAGIWNFFEIYFPVFVSDNIQSLTGSFKDRIRFVFSLEKLNLSSSK